MADGKKDCLFCRSEIPIMAMICPFCRSDLMAAPIPPAGLCVNYGDDDYRYYLMWALLIGIVIGIPLGWWWLSAGCFLFLLFVYPNL